jgi:hypothetical protein
MFNERNQNPITTLIQEAANFLMQTGQTLGDVGRILASIGDDLFAAGQILFIF